MRTWLLGGANTKKEEVVFATGPRSICLVFFFFFFLREFQPMTSVLDDSSLSLDQDINQFLV